jgi:pimeloyl-ACP methyl ester carboxylesterase
MAISNPNIVLVHGAWADGSSWDKIIPLLQQKGFHVAAAHLPFTTLAEDAAAVKRMIALQDGPVLLVGHSYGCQIANALTERPVSFHKRIDETARALNRLRLSQRCSRLRKILHDRPR